MSSLRRWYYQVKDTPRVEWPALLADRHAGTREARSATSAEAWDYFKADYLRPEAPAATACYDRLLRAAAEHGWSVASLRTLERRLERELPPAVIVRARGGRDQLKRLFPAQERDHTVFGALEAVNADGHKFDVFVRWPDGEVGRPVMVAWQDIYSGKVLSYRIDKTENTDAVRLSFGDLVDTYGFPEHAYLDNGRAFASKWMTGGTPTRFRFKVRTEDPVGIMTRVGVQVHWATPYHGQAKPIERAFRDLCEYVARHPRFAGAYTGNKPDAKPENYASKAIDLDVFLDVLEQELIAHNAREGRRSSVCGGRSFDAVFAESYQSRAIPKATAADRRLWLLAAEGVRVRRDGTIVLQADTRNRYWNAELLRHAGDPVVVRFDPQDLHSLVHVYSADERYIGAAECLEKAGFDDSQAAREHAKNRRRFMRAASEQLAAERRMSALDAARLIPSQARADIDARVVRPLRPAVALAPPEPAAPARSPEVIALRERRDATERHEAQLAEVIELTGSPKTDHARWMLLEMRIAAGEDIPLELHQRLAWYAASPECALMRRAFEEHGLDIEEMAAG